MNKGIEQEAAQYMREERNNMECMDDSSCEYKNE